MARAKAPKNTGSQGFTHTSTPSGSSVKAPAMSMAVGGKTSPPPQPACTEMSDVADGLPSGGGMAESM